MHTEEQAKTKWCHRDVEAICVASNCMAWRWVRQYKIDDEFPAFLDGVQTIEIEPTQGYCGLAGNP